MADSTGVRSPAGDGQRRCTYCYQELNEMTDPRQLACNHIVCLTCLENDWKLDELQCRACSKDISVDKIEQLPQVTIETEPVTPAEDNEPGEDICHNCDICECPSPAVEYCIECCKKICQAHKESHGHYFKEAHQTIKISAFSRKPDYYSGVPCDHHPNKFIQFVCKKCDDMRCPSCLSTLDLCKSGGSHQYLPLEQTRTDFELHINGLLKKLSGKITSVCNLEKSTWQTVDTLAENCEKMLEKVEECANKKIAEIQKQADNIKKEIAEYLADKLKKVEAYIQSLTVKLDSLESTQNSVQSCMRANHVTALIKQKPSLLNDINTQMQTDTSTEFNCPKMTIFPEGQNGATLPLKFMSFEDGQKFIKNFKLEKCMSLDRVGKCQSLAYNEIGQLVFGSLKGCFISQDHRNYGIGLKDLIEVGQGVVCVAQYRMAIYTMLSSGNVFKIRLGNGSPDFDFILNSGSQSHPKMCVSGEFLVVTASHKDSITVYSLFTKTTQEYTIPDIDDISSMCFDHDGSLLILDSKTVTKFKVTEGAAPLLMWRCDGILEGQVMCVDTARTHKYIFVYGSPFIHLIHAGRKTRTVELGVADAIINMPSGDSYGSIAVYENIMVSSSQYHSASQVNVFRIS